MEKVLNFIKKNYCFIVPMLFGAIFFLYLYSFKTLSFTNTAWMINSRFDIVGQYIGWEFFRNSSWHLLFGINDAITYPYNVSVMFTDSIPLFAVFFKLFNNILPETFQYFGLYILISYVLYGLFSSIILRKFIKNDAFVCLLSIFSFFTFVIINRTTYHITLSAQYLILAAVSILLYKDKFSNKKMIFIWGLLGFVLSGIHIYFLLIDGIILIGYIIYEILDTKNYIKSFLSLVSYLVTSIINTFLLGGFISYPNIYKEYLGRFNTNLNTFFNSESYSSILAALKTVDEQYEGDAYLGIGIMLLFIIFIVILIVKLIKKEIKVDWKLFISLFFITFVSTYLAFYPNVYFGEKYLFSLYLPTFAQNIFSSFRSSARLIWVLYYLIIFSSFIGIYQLIKNKAVTLLIILLTISIQIIDFSSYLTYIHNQNSTKDRYEYTSSLDKKWDKLLDDYKYIYLSDQGISDQTMDYDLLYKMAKNRNIINNYYLAQYRYTNIALTYFNEKVNNLNDNELIILKPVNMIKYLNLPYNYYYLDGFYIISKNEIEYLDKIEDLSYAIIKYDNTYYELDSEKNYKFTYYNNIYITQVGTSNVCEFKISDEEANVVEIYKCEGIEIYYQGDFDCIFVEEIE